MDAAATRGSHRPRRRWAKVLAVAALVLAGLVLLLALFPWDVLRGPLNRYVSERTGRHFEITRRLDVKLGRTTRIQADGIVFANPAWAQDPYLVKAKGAEVHVRLWPLLRGRIELPRVELRQPVLGLQMEEDGRRTWDLARDDRQRDPKRPPPRIDALVVDQGSAHFVAPGKGADIHTEFAIDAQQQPAPAATATAGAPVLPLTFKARGTWQREAFTAEGRTGNVLSLGTPQAGKPFPMEVRVAAGDTRIEAEGSVAGLPALDGADLRFALQGPNLAQLYKLAGVVLPESPKYAVRGRLNKQDALWRVSSIDGRLGSSDIAGELALDRGRQVPLLTGQLRSRSLDLDDPAPLVGLDQERKAGRAPRQGRQDSRGAQAQGRGEPQAREAGRRVLPDVPLDVGRLRKMDADVRVDAARMVNVRALPLERMAMRVRLQAGVLRLDDMDLGFAGGRLVGSLHIDGQRQPTVTAVKLDARGLELGQLTPALRSSRANAGKLHGVIELQGQGRTVAQMLGTSSGNVSLLMGQGRMSNLLLEIAGLDGAEIVKFLLGRDQAVQLRCAASAFDVKDGLMSTRALVLDTVDTVIWGSGTINLANEALDLTFKPVPKDPSILSIRSPLRLTGTLGNPQGGLEMGALAGRAGLALALGAINPLLALAATIETGPGENADCSAVLREAASPPQQASQEGKAGAGRAPAATMGAPAADKR